MAPWGIPGAFFPNSLKDKRLIRLLIFWIAGIITGILTVYLASIVTMLIATRISFDPEHAAVTHFVIIMIAITDLAVMLIDLLEPYARPSGD